MTRTRARRLAAILTTAAVLSGTPASVASAERGTQSPPPSQFAQVFADEFPAEGIAGPRACTFDLKVEGTFPVGTTTERGRTSTFRGVGSWLTFTNLDDPTRRITFPPTRVVTITKTIAPDTTVSTTYGSSAILLFKGDRSLDRDQRKGPSTAVHVGGKIVYLDRPDIEAGPDTEAVRGIDVLIEVDVKKTTDVCRRLAAR